MSSIPAIVFDGQTSNGDSAAYDFPGGVMTLTASGTFNGATVTLLYKPSIDSDFVTVSDLSFTDLGVKNIQLSAGQVKANLASAGGSTDVKLVIS
jgi:hypothetical protein